MFPQKMIPTFHSLGYLDKIGRKRAVRQGEVGDFVSVIRVGRRVFWRFVIGPPCINGVPFKVGKIVLPNFSFASHAGFK